MKAKNYLMILKGGIISSMFFVLFVFPSLLFPYISSKQLTFNILIEVLLVIWLVFIWRYKAYRPKKNLMIYGLASYLLVILISAFSGVDFNLSFWGDVERMLGFFHILHFFIFFLILISVFRSWKDWRLLFQTSVLVATIVSLIGLLGENPHSTIGNTTYVSGYLIFNLFFAAILFLREKTSWRYIYLVPTLIMLLEFKNMRTSGAIIGLAAGIFVALLLTGLLHRNKKIKYWFLSVSAVLVLLVVFIFSQQQETWFQNSFLKNLTAQKATFQTRLLSWESAWQDFGNHPVLGTGFGNYAITFDRHFDPEFLNYDKNETYFDRAHNNLIDIASTTGILGLLTYLSIFVFLFYYLVTLWKRNEKKIDLETNKGERNLELVLLTGLFVAYLIQNLAVFDSFVTYIGLMMSLGFVYWLVNEYNFANEENRYITSSWLSKGRERIFLISFLILAFIFINQYNLKPWRMLEGVIVGYGQIVKKDIIEGFDTFRASLYDGPLDRDGRSALLNLVASNPVVLSSLTEEIAHEEFNYLVSLAKKNWSYNPQDTLFNLQLAQLYDMGSRIFYEDEEMRNEYSDLSLKYSNQAIETSPGRIPLYFSKSQALFIQGDIDAAIETLEFGLSLNPEYLDTYCRLSQMYKANEEGVKALEATRECIDGGAVSKLGGNDTLLNTASFLADQGDFKRSLIVLERLVQSYDSDANLWLNLAKLYLLTDGNEIKARQAANKAVSLNPSLAPQAEALFILE